MSKPFDFDALASFGVEGLRIAYGNAIMKQIAGDRYNMTEAVQLAVLGEIDQFLVDMLDCCEQSDVAEPAIIAARTGLAARPGPSLHDRMNAIVEADAAFLAVWDRLAEEGTCDTRGGAEQRRVKDEWYAAGKPEIEPFIRERANVGPR